MPEKRGHPRLAIDVKVSMNTESNFYAGLTENISEGGIFIATYDNFPMGSTMDLAISLPGQPPLQVKGVVRWIREHSQFTDDVSWSRCRFHRPAGRHSQSHRELHSFAGPLVVRRILTRSASPSFSR